MVDEDGLLDFPATFPRGWGFRGRRVRTGADGRGLSTPRLIDGWKIRKAHGLRWLLRSDGVLLRRPSHQLHVVGEAAQAR